MDLYLSEKYIKDVAKTASISFGWEKLNNKSIAISGGTGMIGSYLIDVLLYRNEKFEANTDIYIFGRSKSKVSDRFSRYVNSHKFHFIEQDINQPILNNDIKHIDYVIHAASNTHPVAYANDPIGTISANVIGTANFLDWADKVSCERFVFLSSVEIYGENRGDIEKFDESYLGYIDCNTMRAGYPESKRTGEALCQAYRKQRGMNIVIPRLSRVYGPTMLMTDTKALSQFIIKAVNRENIILKSEGTQKFSYSYVADAVTGILSIMLDGEDGDAYNVASESSDITLKELAQILADIGDSEVIFELPDIVEAAGYSKATKAMLDISKIYRMGWKSQYDMSKGLQKTVDILREINQS